MNRQIVGVVLAIVFITLIGFVVFLYKQKPSQNSAINSLNGSISITTRTETPNDVAVPDLNAKNVPQNIAAPTTVSPAGLNTSANFRSFAIRVEHNTFAPDTIIVKKDDIVHATFTAIDKDYDFIQPDYGLSIPLPKGKDKVVEFGAVTSGKFTFFCKSCGGPTKGPVGYIVITQK